MSVNKSRSPYFDDYDAAKGYHEVLFVPRRSVQVRELNQIQTMFYEQVRRFGDHTFEEGSMVIPGDTTYDLNYNYVKVTVNNYESIKGLLSADGTTLTGQTSLAVAEVKEFVGPEGSDPSTFFVKYLDSGTNGESSEFSVSETLDIIDAQSNTIGTATVSEVGTGSKFAVASGVYYVGGRFVLNDGQSIILDKYSATPSYVVGFLIEETAVSSTDDIDLFDNAQGTPNFTAPGADRLKVDLKLTKYALDNLSSVPDNFVEIFRISNGEIQRKARGPEYNILEDTLAQRTYDESGDYTVKSFTVNLSEHLKDGDNGGIYEAADGGDESKFVVGVEQGLAYVRGYEVENLSTKNISVDKARETGTINNSSISARLGFYVEVTSPNIIPDLSTLQQINFYSQAAQAGSILGTANVRVVEKNGSNYRLYLFNVKNDQGRLNTDFIESSVSVGSNVGEPFTAELAASTLYDTTDTSLVYQMPADFIKTLRINDESDTSYTIIRQFEATTDTNGSVVFTAGTNELFVAQPSDLAFGCYTDTPAIFSIDGAYTLGGSPTGKVITIDLGVGNASRPVRINLQIAKEQATQRSKVLTSTTAAGSLDASDTLSLGKADAYSITSVIDDNGTDVTYAFDLFENKTPSYYGVSYVKKTGNATVVEPITVTFDYFEHSSGEYFSVDSYVDFSYENIPTENGVALSDVIDFRPRMADDGSGFSGTGSNVSGIPVPYSIIRNDIEFYLPRIDKVYVNSDGQFGVVNGVPALDPSEPEDPSNSMILYTLRVPAYTFDVGDIQAIKNSNRRYTMRDIGRLENRISNLEYYVSLNALEKDASDFQVVDPDTGLNRFKNGFLVDAFQDHSVGDFAWTDYHVSMNPSEGDMGPEFSLNAVDYEYDGLRSSGVVVNDGIVTLPYTEKAYIGQNLRTGTMNVNPYAIFRWSGEVTMSPSSDSWIDTRYTNPDVTYRVFNNGRLTQSWKSWQLNWSGGRTVDTNVSTSTSSRLRTTTSGGFWASGNRGVRRTTSLTQFTTTNTTTTTTTTNTNIDVINDRVLDTSVIPFMRTIDVSIRGVGHKPNTRLHFFFDKTGVNAWVKPSGGSFGNAVVTDSDGEFTATFRIPNNNTQKFRTGEKLLEVIDRSDNKRELSQSYGSTIFSSKGVLQTRRRTIVATRTINTSRTRTSSTDSEVIMTQTRWVDPIAESFLVERTGGVFLTAIETFFKTKDSKTPITLDIREMSNGYPTQSVVPGSEVTMKPSQVSTSNDGSVPTKFVFPYPIYLQENQEYCFVLTSNSNAYNAFVAEMGQQDLGTGRYVSKQPYVGVMFKSQNSSTWTAEQQMDIQFQMYRAEFETGTQGMLYVTNKDMDTLTLPDNSIYTTNGSSVVSVKVERHGYVPGTKVVISGATGGNGVDAVNLNGEHTVVDATDPEFFTIDTGDVADATGQIGGSATELSVTFQATAVNPNFTDLQFPDTSIEYAITGVTGQSLDGTETPYTQVGDWTLLQNKEVHPLTVPWLVTNQNDEDQNLLAGEHSSSVRMVLNSDNPNVSPVVDLDRASVIMPCNMINGSDTDLADGSNNWANYRTRIAGLESAATSIKTLIDINKPQDADVVVSYRVGNSEEEVDDADWQIMTAINTQTTGSNGQFLENEYGDDGIGEYTFFQIMVQLKTKSSANAPVCKRLRVLALGT